MFCDMIDQIIEYNKTFVAQKGYEKYLTDKYPDKGGTRDVDNIVGGYQLAVLSCMDTRLTELLPAAALAVCRRGGATATLQTMNMMFEMMNMPVVTSQYWNIAYGAGKGEVKLDSEGMQTMRTLATNMAFLLQKIHADGHPAPQRDERPAFMNFIR